MLRAEGRPPAFPYSPRRRDRFSFSRNNRISWDNGHEPGIYERCVGKGDNYKENSRSSEKQRHVIIMHRIFGLLKSAN